MDVERRQIQFFRQQFPRYSKVVYYLRSLQKKYPKLVELEVIGFTCKGREIYMIKISNQTTTEKGIVLIDACIHAREWITITTALCVIDHLMSFPQTLTMFDFYIIPCLNPDGYEFSHTVDRLWRKNLNPNGSCCYEYHGVDLNRNFPVGFGRSGSSVKRDRETFRGEFPLSEPESLALHGVFQKHSSLIKLYISLHSYGNCILYPWGYTFKPVKDEIDLRMCADKARIAMYKPYRNRYRLGSIAEELYIASGNTTDYARKQHNIKFVYTIELQKGYCSGFTIRTDKISQVGSEIILGVEAMALYVYNYFNNETEFK